MKLEMLWARTKHTHIQVPVRFPETEACESYILPLENELLDGEARKSSLAKSEVFGLHSPCPCWVYGLRVKIPALFLWTEKSPGWEVKLLVLRLCGCWTL